MKILLIDKTAKLWRPVALILAGLVALVAGTVVFRWGGGDSIWLEGAAAWAYIIISTALIVEYLQKGQFTTIETPLQDPGVITSWVRLAETSPYTAVDTQKIVDAYMFKRTQAAEAKKAREVAERANKIASQQPAGVVQHARPATV